MAARIVSRQQGRFSILLKNPRLRRLWSAHLISMLGDGLYSVALPLLVYQHTHSAIDTAATLAATAIPYFLVGMIAGIFVDRWDRRLAMMAADLTRAVALVIFPLLLLRGFNLWLTLAMALLLPAASRFFSPAQRASVPSLVTADELMPANGLIEGAGNAAYIAGPALAGVLMAVWGAVPLLFLDAASFVASALLLWGLPLGKGSGRSEHHIFAEMGEGLRVVWNTPTLRSLFILAVLIMPCFGAVPALLPVWTQHSLAGNAEGFGLLTSAFFVGALIGSLLIVRSGHRLASGTVFVLCALGMGVAISTLGWSHLLFAGLVAMSFLGFCGSCYNVAALSLLQRFSPGHTLGRVLAFHEAGIWSLRPVGVFITGVVANSAGVYATFAAVGVLVLAMGAAATASRTLRGVDGPVTEGVSISGIAGLRAAIDVEEKTALGVS